MIDFETFTYTLEDATFDVKFWKKDYTATYNSKIGPLSYGTHIPYCCPKIFTKELLITRIETSVGRLLKNSEAYISENKTKLMTFITNLKKASETQIDELISLRSQKSELKKHFKIGEITENEYQKQLKPIKGRINAIKSNPQDSIKIFARATFHENYDRINVISDYLLKVYNHPELLSPESVS